VLVDDYDLVATQSGNPLLPLAELIPQGKDIGLHVIIVPRSGGASRSLYDPLIQRIRELGMPGLLLSGTKDEGALLGTTKPMPLAPGRGQLVSRRRGVQLIQLAWVKPE
jgi:S-DNA-T family DNA segregation ATPase FtsK/SpoIIIE